MNIASFADRDGLIWVDGQLVPWRTAQFHVLTHGLHYASAVFEGERAYGGNVFQLSEHSQRLIDSAHLLGMRLSWTREQIEAATMETVKANGLVDCYVRPIAWRGSEQLGVSAQNTEIHLAIAAWEWTYFNPRTSSEGLRLDIAQWRRPEPSTAPTRAKATGLYMICTLAKHAAEAAGYDDAMMLDWRGQIAEATGANIFFVRNGVLHTPLPDCFLDGITRRAVIRLAGGMGVEVIERPIWPDELATFEQAFVTGTAAEVTPISEIGSWRFKVGELTRSLTKAFAELVRSRPPEIPLRTGTLA